MDNIRLSDLVNAMRRLTTSANQHQVGEGSTSSPSLDLFLQRNLETFNKALEEDPEFKDIAEIWSKVRVCDDEFNSSVRWTFTCYCLKMLHILVQCLKIPSVERNEPPKLENAKLDDMISQKEEEDADSKGRESKDKVDREDNLAEISLGVQDQKVVRTVLQFVVCLGVCPYLQTGVGIPLQMRSGFSLFVGQNPESFYSNQYCLYTCLKVLLQCTEVTAVSTLVLSQHLTDILAGLLQILHTKQINNDPSNAVVQGASERQSVQIPDFKVSQVDTAVVITEKMHANNESDNTKMQQTKLDKSSSDGSDIVKVQDTDCNRTIDNRYNTKSTTHNVNDLDRKSKADAVQIYRDDTRKISDTDIEYCEKALNDLYSRVYPPLLVKTLLLLQGGPKLKKPPSSKYPVLPPAPQWLRRIITQQLAKITMRPKGVQYVLRGMLDGPGAATGTSDWRRCDAVAKVIACCPLQTVTLTDYYKVIGPQIIELLHLEDKQLSKQYLRIACSVISNMAVQDIVLTRQFVLKPLIEPLLECQADGDISDKYRTVSESNISLCIEDCHKVFVCGSSENQKLIIELQPVILTLFELLVFTKPGVSSLKKPCHELVVCYLRNIEQDVGLTCLELMTFQESQYEDGLQFPRMHPNMRFQHGPNGGVQVTTTNETDQETSEDNARVDCLIAIIKDLGNTDLAGAFFVQMLKELTRVIQTEVETVNSVELPRSRGGNLLEGDNYKTAEQFYKRLTLLNILACLCEELGPDCIQNATHALQFVKATLERGVQVCKSTDDPITEVFESETLSMAMGLLTATLTGAYQLSDENRQFMNELLPLLQEISNNHPESSVQEMATDIRIAIATHGAVWSETTKTKSSEFSRVANKISQESKPAEKKIEHNKPKIEVIKDQEIKANITNEHNVANSESMTDNSNILNLDARQTVNESGKVIDERNNKTMKITEIDSRSGDNNRSTKAVMVSSEYKEKITDKTMADISNKTELSQGNEIEVNNQTVNNQPSGSSQKPMSNSELTQAYEELCDPLLPVRGHGLIRLTRMVQRRNPEILQRQQAVLTIFMENLDHSDSYLYLAAVSGLAALSDLCPDLVLPKLCEQFANFDQLVKEGGAKRKVELRMKIGEVLVKASRCLGDTIPKYRDMLIRSFLVGTKDQESFVRASSLSNLGEICKLLRFSLGNYVHEVFECYSSLLRFDRDLEVRKAAGQAITLLLQGMNGDSFKVLEDVIKDLYRALKQSMLSEKEDGVKVHVTLALNELDEIMRNKLFPTQKLEKRIQVLDFD